MTRTVKTYEVRKEEILNAAQSLFYKKGFSKSSVNDIIAVIGIAKGTFYHYFNTKNDLLLEIIARDLDETEKRISKIVSDNKLNTIEKLNRIYSSGFLYRLKNKKVVKLLLRVFYLNEENIIFLHKRNKEYQKRIAPLFALLLEEGVKRGVLRIKLPKYSADILLNMGSHLDHEFADCLSREPLQIESVEELILKCKAYEEAVHKLLGLKEGSIKIVNGENIVRFYKTK